MIRRSPLKRSTKPLRRSRLRRVSKKRRQVNEAYFAEVVVWKAANPFCKFPGCTARTDDAHHTMKRGKYLMDTATWMPVCRVHHDWIHSHQGEARRMGLLQ